MKIRLKSNFEQWKLAKLEKMSFLKHNTIDVITEFENDQKCLIYSVFTIFFDRVNFLNYLNFLKTETFLNFQTL